MIIIWNVLMNDLISRTTKLSRFAMRLLIYVDKSLAQKKKKYNPGLPHTQATQATQDSLKFLKTLAGVFF